MSKIYPRKYCRFVYSKLRKTALFPTEKPIIGPVLGEKIGLSYAISNTCRGPTPSTTWASDPFRISSAKMNRAYATGAKDRNVPAENDLAERDLRPTVIARKVSFGSQSDAGAHGRGVLMTVLGFLKTQGIDVATHLKDVLDEIAKNIHQESFPLLFPRDPQILTLPSHLTALPI